MQNFRLNIKKHKQLANLILSGIMVAAFAMLLVLVYYQVRPIPTVDIKVPVATDKAEYYPGQRVGGLFFGDVFYEGKVEILREVFCKNYHGIIKTDTGEDLFKGISRKIHLEGTSRDIGNLPEDVPIGENCVIQFVNSYHIATPFGTREIENKYYTQNFKIIDKESQDAAKASLQESIDRQNSTYGSPQSTVPPTPLTDPAPQEATPAPTVTVNNQPPTTPSKAAEPITVPRQCTINLLGLCL